MSRLRSLIGWLCLIAVAVTFSWAGGIKAWDPQVFSRDIDAYQLLPWPLVVATALYLPWLELMTAVTLFLPRWRDATAWVLGLMLLIFLFALGAAWWRGLDIVCGCFGDAGRSGYLWPLARDVLLITALIVGVRWTRPAQPRQTAA